MTPKASILIPVYNREHMIGDCISSAIAQTVHDIEVVVVDNHSTDRTWEICKEFAAKDKRVRIFRNNSNIGPVRNWQKCLEEARGAYAKLLFSDDLIDPKSVELSLSAIENERIGFVFTPVIIGTSPWEGQTSFKFRSEDVVCNSSEFLREILFDGDAPVSPAAAIFRLDDLRRNLRLNVPSIVDRGYTQHGAGVDMLLYLLAAAQYPEVAFLAKPMTFFRAHSGSISVHTEPHYLHRAYRQAKIWFAENYLDLESCQSVGAFEWKRQCRKERSWELPTVFLKEYTGKAYKLPLTDLLKVMVLRTKEWRRQVPVRITGG